MVMNAFVLVKLHATTRRRGRRGRGALEGRQFVSRSVGHELQGASYAGGGGEAKCA